MSCARWPPPHPSRNLCLTGGVALNCVANARILRDTDYRQVWVPPCASDTGAPLGQRAVAPASDARPPAHLRAEASLYGTGYSDDEMCARARPRRA